MVLALDVNREQELMRTATFVYVFSAFEFDFKCLEKKPAMQFLFCPIQPSDVGSRDFTLMNDLEGIWFVLAREENSCPFLIAALIFSGKGVLFLYIISTLEVPHVIFSQLACFVEVARRVT